MADGPDQEPGNPEPEAEAERRRQRAVNDGDGAWRAGEQDRLGERAVQRHLEALDVVRHVTSAPPPKAKKVRKKLVAAKAIVRPKTICSSRRKPPEVSPKASERPEIMRMITAMMRATGTSTACRSESGRDNVCT